MRLSAIALQTKGSVQRKVLDWAGDPSCAGDSVPLRFVGGLHALVLSGKSPELKRLYPPCPVPPDEVLLDGIKEAMSSFAPFLLDWLDSPPQTNEPARMAPLLAAGHWLTERFGLPLNLLELGSSAGLNLRWDHVAVVTETQRLGAEDAALTLNPEWTGQTPRQADLRIASTALST